MVLSILWTPQKHALGCHKNIHSKRRSLTNFCRRMQVTQKLKSLVKNDYSFLVTLVISVTYGIFKEPYLRV